MGDNSKIEWTDASWNPIVGCSIVSPGCTHCYAMRQAQRVQGMMRAQGKESHYDGTTKVVKGKPVWTGTMREAPEHLVLQPLRWATPRMIFVNSMSDLFHESVPNEWIDKVFAVMALAPWHTFQVLTKRAERMRAYVNDPETPQRVYDLACDMATSGIARNVVLALPDVTPPAALTGHGVTLGRWPLANVWLGVSAEDQRRYDERRDALRATPAAVRFLSIEPLLGPIGLNLSGLSQVYRPIHWVIVGGESGPDARPMHPDWARSLRDQCSAAGVPFFFKQWGEWEAWICAVEGKTHMLHLDGKLEAWRPGDREHMAFLQANNPYQQQSNAPRARPVARVGKRYTGRLLDGREHNGMPERANG
jgi:protein gp37